MPRYPEINPLHKEFNAREEELQELVKDNEASGKKIKCLESNNALL